MDVAKAINGLMARYNQIQEALSYINRWREAASADIRKIANEIQLMGKASLERERLVAGLKADNKSFQGQLRSMAIKVDELSRRVQHLEDGPAQPRKLLLGEDEVHI